MMTAKNQIQSLAETLTSTELFGILKDAGPRYINAATSMVEAIKQMADEIDDDATFSAPDKIADFVEALQHAINGIFLIGNAAVTKIKSTGDKDKIEIASRAVSNAATSIAINAIVVGLRK